MNPEAFYLQDENEFNYIIKENDLISTKFEGEGFYVVLNKKLKKVELDDKK